MKEEVVARDPIRVRVSAVNKVVNKLDTARTSAISTLAHKFLDSKGDIVKELMADWLHPTAKGDQI